MVEAARHALRVDAYGDALGFADWGLDRAGREERPALLELRADALHELGDPAAGVAYRAALTLREPDWLQGLNG